MLVMLKHKKYSDIMSVSSQSISEIVDDERLTHAVGRRPVPSSAVAEELGGSCENSSFLAAADEDEGIFNEFGCIYGWLVVQVDKKLNN